MAETAGDAAAAAAKALIESAYLVARHQPRDMTQVRSDILKACQRPRFAEKAIWSIKRGKQISGLSIRFAEECARCMGNLHIGAQIVFEDDLQRIVHMVAVDLQRNVPREYPVVVDKTIERSQVPEGEEALSWRTNSYGKPVYRLRARAEDVAVNQAREMAKAERQLILKFVPADVLDEALEAIRNTLADADAKDPDAGVKRIVDAFALLRIDVSDIERLLGYPVAKIRPVDLTMLRTVYTAIHDGEYTLEEAIAELNPETPKSPGDPSTGEQKGTAGLKAKIAEQKAKQEAKRQGSKPEPLTRKANESDEEWNERQEAERQRRLDAGEPA